MRNQLLYSILQYKHSLILRESINIGILFSFPEENKLYFVKGNIQRVKSLYPNFDSSIFNIISKTIITKVYSQANDYGLFAKNIFYVGETTESLREYINNHILTEDSTSLQFSDPFTASNHFDSKEKAIESFSNLLLPDLEVKKEIPRHNELYIQKRFLENLVKKNINPEHRISRNKEIAEKGITLNFELSWKNGITHLIKPISFDLKDGKEIQTKSVTYFGYLDLLNEYAKRNGYKFDLLIGKPQDDNLNNYYENAIEILSSSPAPKEIVTEDNLLEYSEKTAEVLHKMDF